MNLHRKPQEIDGILSVAFIVDQMINKKTYVIIESSVAIYFSVKCSQLAFDRYTLYNMHRDMLYRFGMKHFQNIGVNEIVTQTNTKRSLIGNNWQTIVRWSNTKSLFWKKFFTSRVFFYLSSLKLFSLSFNHHEKICAPDCVIQPSMAQVQNGMTKDVCGNAEKLENICKCVHQQIQWGISLSGEK